MKKIIYSTYCLVIAGLFGLITLPALAKETGDDSLEGHQAISTAATGAPLPASITALLDQGLKFHGTFNAPDDIQGYALSYDNEPVAAYKCLFKINRAIGSVAVKQPVYLITQALKREVRTQWQPGILHPSP